ncbi:MAG: hypothetical protein V3U98_08800 [Acidobacteriota bacterium]
MTCPCGRKMVVTPVALRIGLCFQCRHPNLPKHPSKLRLIQGGKK